jgi:NSS family neurotransmitter:Na+ symporter
MGTMITYSSYFTQNNNMINTATRVAVSDIIVSILAGIAIFPALFSFGMEPSAGPGLLFMTIPLVFSQMPFGNLLLIAFFTLTAIAATTASISIVETTVLFFSEQMKVPRKIAVAINISIMAIIGITASLSASSEGLLGGVKIFGKTFFDFFDFASSNILLPLGGLFIAIFIGYVIKKEDFVNELSNNGTIRNAGLIKALYFLLRYITPLLVILVFLNSLGII